MNMSQEELKARVYGITIIEDVELYENGDFVDCCGPYIYDNK